MDCDCCMIYTYFFVIQYETWMETWLKAPLGILPHNLSNLFNLCLHLVVPLGSWEVRPTCISTQTNRGGECGRGSLRILLGQSCQSLPPMVGTTFGHIKLKFSWALYTKHKYNKRPWVGICFMRETVISPRAPDTLHSLV